MNENSSNPALFKMYYFNFMSVLVFKCQERGLDSTGPKKTLAHRLTEDDMKQFEKDWNAITNG